MTVRGVLAPGQLFADLNTASPALKAELAAVVETGGAQFVDVALMGTVPGNGLLTPCLVSGSGARAYAELFRPLGTPVEVVDGEAGQAAERKLLRSVFMKGMAAAAIESLAAARAAGCEEWLHDELAQVFATPPRPCSTASWRAARGTPRAACTRCRRRSTCSATSASSRA